MKCLARVRNRWKRCYELAGRAMLEEPGADRFTLVHGTIFPPIRIPHAWIENGDGRVYDPTDHEYFPVADYYSGQRSAVAQHRYRQHEVAQLVSQNNHYGPWQLISGEAELKAKTAEYIRMLNEGE